MAALFLPNRFRSQRWNDMGSILSKLARKNGIAPGAQTERRGGYFAFAVRLKWEWPFRRRARHFFWRNQSAEWTPAHLRTPITNFTIATTVERLPWSQMIPSRSGSPNCAAAMTVQRI